MTANEPYRLGMPNHNYLGNTLWKIADELRGKRKTITQPKGRSPKIFQWISGLTPLFNLYRILGYEENRATPLKNEKPQPKGRSPEIFLERKTIT